MEFTFKPIGIIHTPYINPSETPIQSSRSRVIGTAEVYSSFEDGLVDLEGFSHVYLFYAFHLSEGYSLLVKPFLDNIQHGVFATRHPCRPNPIGFSLVKLLDCRAGQLTFEGADMLDRTPLLDIKPFVPDFDLRSDVRSGWYTQRSKE